MRPLRRAFVVVVAAAAGCAHGGGADDDAADYRVEATVAPRAASLVVRVVRPGLRVDRVAADDPRALAAAADAADDGPGAIRYTVDLARLPTVGGGFANPARRGDDVVLSPDLVFLRPADAPRRAPYDVALDLPAGVFASTPWRELGPPTLGDGGRVRRVFRVDGSAATRGSRIAFTSHAPLRFDADGVVVDLAILDGRRRTTDAALVAHARRAIDAVASLFGPLPDGRAQIILAPRPGRGDPLPFGMAFHGGGRGVTALLDARATDADLARDWVLPHELVHLAMPVFAPEAAWIGEGFTQYYTEVLRARAGMVAPEAAWTALAQGFARARDGARGATLEEASRSMDATHAYAQVYWGGAAVAFRADVALRRRSAGRLSLDDAMRALARRFGGAMDALSAEEALAFLDDALETDVFARTGAGVRAEDAADLARADLVRLGVDPDGDADRPLDDSAPDAALRRDVTAPRARSRLAGPPTAR